MSNRPAPPRQGSQHYLTGASGVGWKMPRLDPDAFSDALDGLFDDLHFAPPPHATRPPSQQRWPPHPTNKPVFAKPAVPPSTVPGTPLVAAEAARLARLGAQRRTTAAAAETATIDTAIRRARGRAPCVGCSGG